MRFLIVSDLHVFDENTGTSKKINRKSLITFDKNQRNPLTDLLTYCENNSVTADVLLCPGDLGDKADIDGIAYAWECLSKLAKVVKAKKVYSVSGNHDFNSKLIDDKYDVREHLVYLDPSYPTAQRSLNTNYWAYGFYVEKEAEYNLIGLNSCHSHGYHEEEQHHGRVSKHVLKELVDVLKNLPETNINILLCHHSPSILPYHELGEQDYMKNGQELISTLEINGSQRWIVVHGHKHYPYIYQAQGSTAKTPIVVSSGSLGSTLYPQLKGVTGNQFHLLEFELSSFDSFGVVGSLQSWEWGASNNWYVPERALPENQHYSGFGYTSQTNTLVNEIVRAVNNTIIRAHEINDKLPMLKFTNPIDLQALKVELQKHNIGLHLDKGRVLEIGKGVS